jgi:hypothetical protein
MVRQVERFNAETDSGAIANTALPFPLTFYLKRRIFT